VRSALHTAEEARSTRSRPAAAAPARIPGLIGENADPAGDQEDEDPDSVSGPEGTGLVVPYLVVPAVIWRAER
jgi:hypothetical protein